MLPVLILVGAILLFVLIFWLMRKEKDLSGFYSEIQVCGRWSAYWTMDFLIVGVACVLALPVLLVLLLMGKLNGIEGGPGIPFVFVAICAALGLGVGVPLFRRAYNKCPEPLRKRLALDMFIIMLGAGFRLAFCFLNFIIGTWMELNKPTAYEVGGKTVYAYPGSNELYDEYGNHVGTANSDRTSAVMD